MICIALYGFAFELLFPFCSVHCISLTALLIQIFCISLYGFALNCRFVHWALSASFHCAFRCISLIWSDASFAAFILPLVSYFVAFHCIGLFCIDLRLFCIAFNCFAWDCCARHQHIFLYILTNLTTDKNSNSICNIPILLKVYFKSRRWRRLTFIQLLKIKSAFFCLLAFSSELYF